VSLCVEAARALADEGVVARVVSMPCWELFDEQDEAYQDQVLGSGAPVLAVEAGASLGWSRYADDSVSLDHFGASGPGPQVMAAMGFNPENVKQRALALLESFEADLFEEDFASDGALDQGEEEEDEEDEEDEELT